MNLDATFRLRVVPHDFRKMWLVLLLYLGLVTAETSNWVSPGGGQISQPLNWDNGIPGASDDAVISIPADSSVASITSQQKVSFRHLKLSGPVQFKLANQLSVTSGLSISDGAEVSISSGAITTHGGASIDVEKGGKLTLSLSQVQSTDGQLSVNVAEGGLLSIVSSGSSGGGAVTFTNAQLNIDGGMEWQVGALILDNSKLMIGMNGQFKAAGDTISISDPNRAGEIHNHGTITFDGSRVSGNPATQLVGVKLMNHQLMRVEGDKPTFLRVLTSFINEGTVEIKGSRVLVFGGLNHRATPDSKIHFSDSGVAQFESGETSLEGVISDKDGDSKMGSMLVQSKVKVSGPVKVRHIQFKGGVWDTASTAEVQQLEWLSGVVQGTGAVAIVKDGTAQLSDPSANKVLQSASLQTLGKVNLASGVTLLLYKGAQITVMDGGNLNLDAHAAIDSDDSNCAITVAQSGSLSVATASGKGDDGNPIRTLISSAVRADGSVSIAGEGAATFRRESRFSEVVVADRAVMHLNGLAANTTFTFSRPLKLNSGELMLEVAKGSLPDTEPSQVGMLRLLDGHLISPTDLAVTNAVLGSPTHSSSISGDGALKIGSLDMFGGELSMKSVSIAQKMDLSGQATKWLRTPKFELLGNSDNHVHPTIVSLGHRSQMIVRPGARLTIHSGSSIEQEADFDAELINEGEILMV